MEENIDGSRSKRRIIKGNVPDSIDLTLNEELHSNKKQQNQREPVKKQHNQQEKLNKFQSNEKLEEKTSSENKQLQFECRICYKRYKLEALLKTHILHHNRKYQCDICLKVFSNNSGLKRHKKIHVDGNREFQCDECPKKFRRKETLENHKIYHHPNNSQHKFECYVCRRPFHVENALLRHLKIHSRDEVFKCEYCSFTYGSKSFRKRHVKSHHPDKWIDPKICEFCRQKFDTEFLLHDHMRMRHPNGRQFECSICKKCFKQEKSLSAHKSTHGVKMLECSYCDLKFSYQNLKLSHEKHFHKIKRSYECLKCRYYSSKFTDVQKHMKKCFFDFRFHCEICQKIFSTLKVFKSHKLTHVEKQFQCDVCLQKFRREDYIKKHKLYYCHSNVHQTEDFKCQFCEKRYWNGGHLIRHIQSLHEKLLQQRHINVTDLLPHKFVQKMAHFQCRFCPKLFFDISTGKKHERTHTKPFKCEQCDYRSANQINLFNHIGRHHVLGSKNSHKMPSVKRQQCSQHSYECFICHYTYKYKGRLISHMLKHDEKRRRFECFICHLTYTSKPSLKEHMLSHDEKKYQCNDCPRKFYRPTDLRQHTRYHSKPYKCKMCSFRSGSAYQLYSHILKEHPAEIDPSNSSYNPSDAVVKLHYDSGLGVWT